MSPTAAPDPTATRIDYNTAGLARADLAEDPVDQLHRWLSDAAAAGDPEPNAMVLATVGADGRPMTRNVLVRVVDHHGVTFFSNRNSAKGRAMDANPVACGLFSWLGMHRQVRVDADVSVLDGADADAYWASRPRDSQLASAASPQGEVVADREALDARFTETAAAHEGRPIPRPAHWVGYRLVPHAFEFWQGRPARLHDRFRYRLCGGSWEVDRLAP